MRNLKALGLSLTIVLVLGAAIASSAMASEFHSAAGSTTLDGVQVGTDKFTVNGGVTTCKKVTYSSGTYLSSTLADWTVHPTYSECTLAPFGTGHVTVPEACNYTITPGTVTPEIDVHGTIDIVCTDGATITVVGTALGVTKCTVHIGSQNGLPVTLTNSGAGSLREVVVDMNISSIAYSQTAGSGLGACSTENATNGKYVGTATFTGTTVAGLQKGIWVE